ncbi:MAG: vWA domain-containing protein, partial [Planctomycetota bacterium]
MTNARRLLSVGAFLGLVGVVSLTHGEPGRPVKTPQITAVPSYLSTPAQERNIDNSLDESRFSKGGVFTYRPRQEEQLFAVALKPALAASAVKGRDYLVMVSLSATQSGEGWQASTRIAESIVEMAGENDRVSLWTVGTPNVTKTLSKGEFLAPKNADDLKKLQAALEKLKTNYPAGDTDLKVGISKAAESFDGSESRQRILVFLGDGQSTHNPLSADDRFALCQELVAKKVGFFPVPLGSQVHPENLHGLATGTGGLVLRTRVGEELLVDCMKRYFE